MLDKVERYAREMMLAVLLVLTVITFTLMMLSIPKADTFEHGQAGEHGKHKGRPFQSNCLPE